MFLLTRSFCLIPSLAIREVNPTTATATKTSLKSGWWLLYDAYSILFNSSNVGNFFWSWILKDFIKVQEKKKKVVVFDLFPSWTKREIRHFHVVVVHWRQRNVQKSVMLVQSCCFANLTYCFFVVLVVVAVIDRCLKKFPWRRFRTVWVHLSALVLFCFVLLFCFLQNSPVSN